ncbi:MAG: type II toxin-antitoxin system VapC family toxin [Clostridia bacterium]|nr:type II toxin-antitoxin system VapC family toxin [Clostridia bacterium]
MTMFTKLFIDTGGFVALADRNDMHHDRAVEFYRALSRDIQRITSLPVISESYAWILYHLGGQQARQWLRYVEEAEAQGLLSVVYPDRELEKKARQIIYRFEDQDISYVDALTLAILQSNSEIDAIFSFDRHMLLAGISVLPGALKVKR